MINKIQKYLSFNDALLIGALVVAFVIGWNTLSAMQRNYSLQQKYNRLSAEVELKELENQNLKYKIEYLKTSGYLELAAREKFNKALPGETLVYLPNSGSDELAPTVRRVGGKVQKMATGWRANVMAWREFLKGMSIPGQNR
jgi:cell division protein FtsB